jgi:glycosyltransferase involved in cell wall biosynthesis
MIETTKKAFAQEGVNVIGHLGASSGLGLASRSFMRALSSRGVPLAALDVAADFRGREVVDDLPDNVIRVRSVADLPFRINLICTSIALLPNVFLRRYPALVDSRFANVALLFWELPVMSDFWAQALRLCDACVVCSPFVRTLVERCVPEMPTVYAEHPLYFPSITPTPKATLGYDESTVLFCGSFDLLGDLTRKNPIATLRAFQEAFPGKEDVGLIIKGNGDRSLMGRHPAGRAIDDAMRSDRRIRFFASTLPYREVLGLYDACDVYVSLHRAEGLGLGPMEAMALGKPVVATGYSGNMAFMTETNSCPVRYQLVPTEKCTWEFSQAFSGEGAVWADADVTHAATLLRALAGDASMRARIGAAARRDIAERQELARSASFLEHLYWAVDHVRSRHRSRRSQWLNTWLAEILNPVLARKNLQAAAARIRLKVR